MPWMAMGFMVGEHEVRPYGLVDGMARIRIAINVHRAIQYDY
jgi:hypothetical protein